MAGMTRWSALFFLSALFLCCCAGNTERLILKSNGSQYTSPETEARKMVMRNICDFMGLLDTAESYLAECQKSFHLMRQIAVQGANGIYASRDRETSLKKLGGLAADVRLILEHSLFNGRRLFGTDSDPSEMVLYQITLDVSEPAVSFYLNTAGIYDELGAFPAGIRPTPESFNAAIGLIDMGLLAVSMERAQLGAYKKRLEYAANYQQLFLNDAIKDLTALRNGVNVLMGSLKGRMQSLVVQSVNGIYTLEDRQQIDMEYQELLKELARLEKLTGISRNGPSLAGTSLRTRDEAEKLMLKMAG